SSRFAMKPVPNGVPFSPASPLGCIGASRPRPVFRAHMGRSLPKLVKCGRQSDRRSTSGARKCVRRQLVESGQEFLLPSDLAPRLRVPQYEKPDDSKLRHLSNPQRGILALAEDGCAASRGILANRLSQLSQRRINAFDSENLSAMTKELLRSEAMVR